MSLLRSSREYCASFKLLEENKLIVSIKMQLGHYVGRHIINLKSNQLKRERKDILGTVLKSKSPSLVLGKANQFGFVFVMFSSLVFPFLIINNIEIRIKARTESKN